MAFIIKYVVCGKNMSFVGIMLYFIQYVVELY